MDLPRTQEIGTVTTEPRAETTEEKYAKCKIVNIIQHIDIYGRYQSTYSVQNSKQNKSRLRNTDYGNFNSISSCTRKFGDCSSTTSTTESTTTNSEKALRLKTFTTATKVTGLWPGNDILSKKAKRLKGGKSGNVFMPNVVPK